MNYCFLMTVSAITTTRNCIYVSSDKKEVYNRKRKELGPYDSLVLVVIKCLPHRGIDLAADLP